jgi:hypothetical protein
MHGYRKGKRAGLDCWGLPGEGDRGSMSRGGAMVVEMILTGLKTAHSPPMVTTASLPWYEQRG